MENQVITQDGEIIDGTALSVVDNTALATISRVEIDQQVATARQYPRSVDRAVKNIVALATLDEETAEECCYALVRRGKRQGAGGGEDNKPIEGPSVRLAEIAAQQWGNCRVDARVVEINRKDKYVAAEGVFHDLETNVAIKNTVRRRISTKSGGLFSDDMIIVTGNAACAIAKRNAILAGIPRGIYRPAYARAREIIAGTAETLTANRTKAIDAFKRFGVMPDQIFEVLEVEGEGDIKPAHIATLRAMFSTLKNGESSVEEMFGKPEPDHAVVKNPLADEAPQETKQETGDDAAALSSQAAGETASTSPETSAADPDAEDEWFARGHADFKAGSSRRAVPPEVRGKPEADRWLAGFDSAKDAAA